MKKILLFICILAFSLSCASKKKERNWNETREQANEMEKDLDKETKKD